MPDDSSRPRVKKTVVENHFPTVFMVREHEGHDELNKKLEQLLLRLERETKNFTAETSNFGGYHSDAFLFARKEPEIVMLTELVQQALHEYVPAFLEANCTAPPSIAVRLWGWGINMRAGDINLQHVHPDAKVSGVYYVSTPPPREDSSAKEGAIMFADPRPGANMNRLPRFQRTHITINPKPGLMVLFPSYYEHAVLPFRGPGVRICIAFNADITEPKQKN